MSSPDVIVPDLPALVRRLSGGQLELVHVDRGATLRLDGAVAADLAAFLGGAAASPRLTGLAALEPALSDVLTAPRRLPWTARAALELGGFDTLFVELTGTCNEHCVHCYAGSGPKVRTALDRATCLAVLADARELGFQRVQLTGGEPLLCDFLPDLVAEAVVLGLWPEIYTNGLLLRDELVARLLPHRPGFAFSFYSHRPEVHDAVTRTPGSQVRTLAAIRRAVAAGFAVRVSVIVMADNAGDVEATVALLREAGVPMVSAAGTHAVGRGSWFGGTWGDVETASHRAPGQPSEARLGTLCVTSTGEVTPCIFSRDLVLGRVPDQRLTAIIGAPRSLVGAESVSALLESCRQRLQCRDCQATAVALRLGAPS